MNHKFKESLTNSNQWHSFSSDIDAEDLSFLYRKMAPILEKFIIEGSFKLDELMIKKNGSFNKDNLVIAINPYKTNKKFFVSHLNMAIVDNDIVPRSLSISKELRSLNILPWVDFSLVSNFGGLKVLLNDNYEAEGYQSYFSFSLKSLYSISLVVTVPPNNNIRIEIKLVNNNLQDKSDEKENSALVFDNCSEEKARYLVYYICFINKLKDRKSDRGLFYNGLIERLPQDNKELDEQLNSFCSVDQDTIRRAILLSEMISLS